MHHKWAYFGIYITYKKLEFVML